MLLNKAKIIYQKGNKLKENKIKLHKEKVQVLLIQMNIKNEELIRQKEKQKNIIEIIKKIF